MTDDEPYIKFFHYKNMINNYRTPNKIVDEDSYVKIMKKFIELLQIDKEEESEGRNRHIFISTARKF